MSEAERQMLLKRVYIDESEHADVFLMTCLFAQIKLLFA